MSLPEHAMTGLLLRPVSTGALASHEEFEIGETDRTYRVFVHRPDTPTPEDGYPIIFLLDGNAFFSMAVAIIRASFFPAEQAIVVGIGHDGAEPFDPRRMYDCTVPVSARELPAFAGTDPAAFGGAAAFRAVIDAVAAHVSERYPIDGGRRALMGYSISGLYVLDTLLRSPASFETYVAISPALWWKNTYVIHELRKLKNSCSASQCRVVLSVGGMEQDIDGARQRHLFRRMYRAMPAIFEGRTFETAEAEMAQALYSQRNVDNARKLTEVLRLADIDVVFTEFRNEDHYSVVPAALIRAMEQILL